MNSTSGDETRQDEIAVRGACGALGFVFGVVAITQIHGSISSVGGWTNLLLALHFGSYAFTYKRSEDVALRGSKKRIRIVLAICSIPPLTLLLCFGDRPGWYPWLLAFFLVSLCLGPVLLLRRFR